jgi:hypothetical protein
LVIGISCKDARYRIRLRRAGPVLVSPIYHGAPVAAIGACVGGGEALSETTGLSLARPLGPEPPAMIPVVSGSKLVMRL